jgi:hypothetical protein
MDNKIGFSVKMLDLNCMNIIKDNVGYPFNMEHTLVNSVVWMTSLCVYQIRITFLILNKRAEFDRDWKKYLLHSSYDHYMLAREVAEREEQILSDTREYIDNISKGIYPYPTYNFDWMKFGFHLRDNGFILKNKESDCDIRRLHCSRKGAR